MLRWSHCFYLAIARLQPARLALVRSRALISDRCQKRDASKAQENGTADRSPELKIGHQVRRAGKPHKLALVACMRRFIVILNAMLHTRQRWGLQQTTAA